MSTLKWGVIGTGAIAKAFAVGLSQTESGTLYAAGSRTVDRAQAFAAEHGASRWYGSYEELLADAEVDAVYVCTPHPFHAEWAVKAIEAGKHVLCEKPLAMNHGEVMAMVETARERGRFFMEAFMYRCHPQTAKLVSLIRDGAIGEIRMIRAAFGFGGGYTFDPDSRTMSPALAGGGIMDVGCYPVSMSRLIARVALEAGHVAVKGDGRPGFSEPAEVTGQGHIGSSQVDEWAAAVLSFPSGIVAQVSTAVRAPLVNTLTIVGAEGRIDVENPWVADRVNPVAGSIVVTKGQSVDRIDVSADRTSFAYEADLVARAIASGEVQGPAPAMNWDDSFGNIAVLDRWRDAIGLVYPAEFPEGRRPVRGVLAKRADAPMRYGAIAGLDKPVSKLIMGCDNQRTYAHGAAIWDDWFERGGNAFDTSWVYGGGLQEKLLGRWIAARGVRDEVVVTVKGAHTPRCLPDLLVEDFNTSLDRLGFDHTDIYIMHRDNTDVPVGEFVDVLNDLVDQRRIRGVFGGSNWSIDRFDEANAYAAKHGKRGFSILNNNLSLARMVKPVWAGCIHVSDEESRRRLERGGITNFSWSSQARGYFLPEAERLKLGSDNFACWDAPDNQARRRRAEEMATKKGCTPINIAAAFVLNQPFPSFALVGPRTIRETATTMAALQVELTQADIDWLWSGE